MNPKYPHKVRLKNHEEASCWEESVYKKALEEWDAVYEVSDYENGVWVGGSEMDWRFEHGTWVVRFAVEAEATVARLMSAMGLP